MPTFKKRMKGPRGLADVKASKNKVTVTYETGESYVILPEDAPEEIQSGQYFVTLNVEKNKIYGLTPPKGAYFAKFKEFLRDKDGLIVIKDKPFQAFKDFSIPQHLEFYPVFVVTGKKYTGMDIINSLWWVFGEHETGQVVMSGRGMGKVADFLEACGVDLDVDDTPYKDDPQELLKMYEKLLLSKDQTVSITISEKGYVDKVSEAPE